MHLIISILLISLNNFFYTIATSVACSFHLTSLGDLSTSAHMTRSVSFFLMAALYSTEKNHNFN